MIDRLRRKFILISTVSVLGVVLSVFIVMTVCNWFSMNRTVDALADSVSTGEGRFPDYFDKDQKPLKPPDEASKPGFITPETKFSTRYFTVWLNQDGELLQSDTEFIAAIDEDAAVRYAQNAVALKRERGWISNYRYKVSETQRGIEVVFIDGMMNRTALFQTTVISATVLIGCAALVLILIVLLSRRAVRPIAESYEKQKQFITDANHELKTPLTLLLANLDIVEAEIGKNEWVDDIRTEGYRMVGLVDRLVALSRMDEEHPTLRMSKLPLSDFVTEMTSEFQPLAEGHGKTFSSAVDPMVFVRGDEEQMRRLLSVLLENAVKYCDANGEIRVSLSGTRRVTLSVENTYRDVKHAELDKLFDRFYRADPARKFTGGYGIGLSVAKAIVEAHRGEIVAYRNGDDRIGFKVVLKA